MQRVIVVNVIRLMEVIFFTGPSLTALLAWAVLKEPLTRLDVLALSSCLVGVVLVARPTFLFAPKHPGIPAGNQQN